VYIEQYENDPLKTGRDSQEALAPLVSSSPLFPAFKKNDDTLKIVFLSVGGSGTKAI